MTSRSDAFKASRIVQIIFLDNRVDKILFFLSSSFVTPSTSRFLEICLNIDCCKGGIPSLCFSCPESLASRSDASSCAEVLGLEGSLADGSTSAATSAWPLASRASTRNANRWRLGWRLRRPIQRSLRPLTAGNWLPLASGSTCCARAKRKPLAPLHSAFPQRRSIWQGRPVLNIFRARSVYFRIEKAIPRFELRIKDLQSFALPLGHIAYIPVSRCLSVILKNIPTTRLTGFEPATSVLTGRCSNLLNYNLFF